MDKHESRPCVYVAYGLMGSTMIFTKKKKKPTRTSFKYWVSLHKQMESQLVMV